MLTMYSQNGMLVFSSFTASTETSSSKAEVRALAVRV